MLRLCLVLIAIFCLSGKGIAFEAVSGFSDEQISLNSLDNNAEHATKKQENTEHHSTDTDDDCCDVDCCEGVCVCPQNSCASGLFLDISTSFPIFQPIRAFALAAIHNLAKIHLPSWYRPPINLLI